jgi:hypothetical protein
MSPIPAVPNCKIAHAVSPRNYKKVQCVLIVNLETMLLNSGTRIWFGVYPFGEFAFGIIISQCYDIKCGIAFVRGYGHQCSVWLKSLPD